MLDNEQVDLNGCACCRRPRAHPGIVGLPAMGKKGETKGKKRERKTNERYKGKC